MRKRQWKKILSVVLALAMVFSMNTAVFADEVTDPVAVEEPAAEAPVAETPVESEPEVPEETTIEEPAAEEAAAEEAEEPAAEAAEEPVAEEVVEEEPEITAEEAAGSDFDYNGTPSATLSACLVDASSGAMTDGAVIFDDDEEGVYRVSINSLANKSLLVTYEGAAALTIKKIIVSGNEELDSTKLPGVVLNTTKGALTIKSVTVSDDRAGADSVAGINFYVSPNEIIKGSTEIGKGGNWNTLTALGADDVIYPAQDAVKISVSLDAATVSFGSAISKININGASAIKTVDLSTYDTEKTSGGARVYDLWKIYEAEAEAADTVTGAIFAEDADGLLYPTTGDKFADEGTAPTTTAKTATTSNNASFTVTTGNEWYVVTKETAGEKNVYEIKRAVLETPALTVSSGKADSTSVTVTGLDANTEYVFIEAASVAGMLTAYKDVGFKTGSIPADTSKYSQSNTWKAEAEGSDTFVVSVNQATGELLIDGAEAADDVIKLSVSEDGANLSINGIRVKGTNAGTAKVVLAASANGVTVNSKNVSTVDGVNLDDLKADKGMVIVSGTDYKFDKTNNTDLKDNDKVYEPEKLAADKNYTISYGSVAIEMSANYAGSVVYAGGETVKEPIELKTSKSDIDAIVGKTNVIILGENGKYFLIDSINGYTAVTPIADIDKYDSKSFQFTAVADQKYAFSTVSYDVADRKDPSKLTFESFGTGSITVTSINKILLTPGQTYYVYTYAAETGSTFANYSAASKVVTLGVKKVINLKLETKTVMFKGDKLKNSDIEMVDDNSPAYVSGNDTNVKITQEDIEAVKTANAARVYSVSSNKKDEAPQSLNSEYELKYGENEYTILSGNEVIVKPSTAHDEWEINLKDGKFTTLSDNSALTVDPSVQYYFGQTSKELAKNAIIAGTTAGTTKLKEADLASFDAEVKKGASGNVLPDEELTKLDKDTEINVVFKLRTLSANVGPLKVQARPVMVTAAQNFFSKMGDAAISDNKINKAQIREIDLFGTPYEKEADFKFIDPDKTTADFTKVVTNDLKNAGKAQDYSLTVSAAAAFSGAVVSENIVISGANAEGFGYYVAPVFNIKFNGEFKSASFNNTQITPVSENVVDSKAVAELKNISTEYKTKKVDDKVVFTADITLPTNVVLLNKASKFIGWKNEVTGETLDAGKEIKSVSENLRYSAVVKEAVPGFPEENALSIVLEDTVTYTGKKHVTDYEDQLGLGRGADNGAAVAFEKTKTTALANSGDVKLEVYVGDTPLIENYDYTATYKNNVNAYKLADNDKSEYAKKAPQVTIKFKNAYSAYPSVVKYFNIEPADITDWNYVQGCGVDSRVYKKQNAKNKNKELKKVFKTDLVNVYTGKKLNVNKDLDWAIEDSEQADLSTAGMKTVKISGKGNYTGDKTVDVLFVDGRVEWITKNIGTGKVTAKVGTVAFNTGDSYWDNADAILADIEANTAEGADITITKQRGDYSTPGKKKLSYTAYVIDETAETPTYKAYKGTYSYAVGPVDPSKITILWNNQDAAASIEVPYAKAGATIDYQFSYEDGEGDLRNILKVSYKNNKKPGTAKAVVAAKNGAFFDKDGKKALKKAPFVKEFTIKQATLQDVAVVTKKYVVSSDAADSSKAAKNIKKTGSIVVVDSMGAPLKDGKDYTIGTVKNNEDGTYTVELNAKGNNYTGSLTIDDAKGITAYLATATIKFGGKNFPKKIAEDDIEKLANGEITNKDFATKYNLTVNGKIAGKKAVFTQDDNFNFVVTKNHKGGKAFIQAVGLEGGIYGGSDVLAKSAINKGVE